MHICPHGDVDVRPHAIYTQRFPGANGIPRAHQSVGGALHIVD